MAKRKPAPLRERIRVLRGEIELLQTAVERQLQENERGRHLDDSLAGDDEPSIVVFERGRARKPLL